MENYNLGQTAAANTMANVKGSRLNTDIDHLLALVRSVHSARERVQRHTSTLGYFSDNAATESGAKVSPISNTLQSAILDLDRAVEGLNAALVLFE